MSNNFNKRLSQSPVAAIATEASPYNLLFPSSVAGTTYSTALAAITAKVPVTTEPATDADNGASVIATTGKTYLVLKPFGTDAENETASFRIWSWRPVVAAGAEVWVPQLLAGVSVTLGTAATTGMLTGGLWADTITASPDYTPSSSGMLIVSPANDSPGYLVADIGGSPLIEIQSTTGGSAASFNALWTTY